MPDIRTYASEANARAALEREGLALDIVTIAANDAGRFVPHFTITEGAPGAAELVTRLQAEGFSHTITKPDPVDDPSGEMQNPRSPPMATITLPPNPVDRIPATSPVRTSPPPKPATEPPSRPAASGAI
jgi:hypothetical protein